MFLLLACASGSFRYAGGTDPVVTAFYLQEEGSERDSLNVLIANSYVDSCKMPGPEDTQAFEQMYLAINREGARIARLTLHRFRKDSWIGDYPLSADPVDTLLDDRDPFVGEASWYAVLEAQTVGEDGLIVEYEPTETEEEWVIPDGDVRLTRDDDRIHGEFGFETIDVSGTFKASPCRISYDDSIFPLVDLLGSASNDDLVD